MSGLGDPYGLGIVDELLRASRATRPARPGDDVRAAMTTRQQCAQDGHRYRVHGKTAPTKLECQRCAVTWAIGARTEPRP